MSNEDWTPPKRNGAAMSANEYCMAMQVLHSLKQKTISPNVPRGTTTRKLLADLLGVSLDVAQDVIRMYNDKEMPINKSEIGRPKLVLEHEYTRTIREIVLEANRKAEPMSAVSLSKLLLAQGYTVGERTLRNHLRSMGLYYGKGHRQNILHDTVANVQYRHTYLDKRLANLNSNHLPIQSEVFLDESYCHLYHQQKLTWLPHGGTVKDAGRKQMMVIFGAFVVQRQDNKLIAEIVKGGKGLLIWPVKGLPRGKRTKQVGRPAADNDTWQDLPQAVREADITPDLHDYHGNFNADLFESIFEDLCETLSERYGACYIHMDGAKYHMGRENSLPAMSWNKAQIDEWYNNQEGVTRPPVQRGKTATKKQLVDHAKQYQGRVTYASYEIARKYGHTIMKTPPYHCELQPIEGLWGAVKEKVKVRHSSTKGTMLRLRNSLMETFADVLESTLLSLYRKSINWCQTYQSMRVEGRDEGIEPNESDIEGGSEGEDDENDVDDEE